MGYSSDGILVYGILLEGEDGDVPEFFKQVLTEEELDDYGVDMDKYIDIVSDTEDAEYAVRKKAHDSYPVGLCMHCSYDYAMYILAVPNTEVTASRGYPHGFKDGLPEVSPMAVSLFTAWAKEHDIQGEPCWILCSLAG